MFFDISVQSEGYPRTHMDYFLKSLNNSKTCSYSQKGEVEIMRRKDISITGAMLLIMSLVSVCQGAILNVPQDFATIHSAITASDNGDTILIADGTYTGPDNRNLEFNGRAITIVSESGPSQCVIDCESLGRGFYFHSGEDGSSVLAGLTIRNGFIAGAYPENCGGGIRIENASPAIINCHLTENGVTGVSGCGGGLFYTGGIPNIENCTITGNCAYNGGGAGFEATLPGSSIRNCVICGNDSVDSGGGVHLDSGSLDVTNCDILNNTAYYHGGGIAFFNSDGQITQCSIEDNRVSREGGGVYCSYDSTMIIGGTPSAANFFDDNIAPVGCDIYGAPNYPVMDARYNTFSAWYLSDYTVYHRDRFDLTGCSSAMPPADQDLYISPDGSDSNDGLSWNTPFQTIRHALSILDSTDPPTIFLGEGTYSGSTTGEIFPLPMLPNSTIVGCGSDTVLDAGGAEAVFYGDHDNGSVLENMILTGYTALAAVCLERCETGRISNCRIIGEADVSEFGIYMSGSNPVIENCEIRSNRQGIYCHFSLPEIIRTKFIDNEVGMNIFHCVYADIRDCEISGEFLTGIYSFEAGPIISGCTIIGEPDRQCIGIYNQNNSLMEVYGTQISGCANSGIVSAFSALWMVNCTLSDNAGEMGGGINFYGHGYEMNLMNVLFENNSGEKGGALYCQSGMGSLQGCTLADNFADNGGAIYTSGFNLNVFQHNILWNNTAVLGPQIFLGEDESPSLLTVDWCDIAGGAGDVFLAEASELTWGDNIIDLDPVFSAGPSGIFYLSQEAGSKSPCVDGGNLQAVDACYWVESANVCMNAMTTDAQGELDSGWIDLGFHYLPSQNMCVNNGDVTGDHVLTPQDALLAFQIYLALIPDPVAAEVCSADCDGSGMVSPGDALCIFQHYLTGECSCLDGT